MEKSSHRGGSVADMPHKVSNRGYKRAVFIPAGFSQLLGSAQERYTQQCYIFRILMINFLVCKLLYQ